MQGAPRSLPRQIELADVHCLPILVAIPHAGRSLPPEIESLCRLTPDQIAQECDSEAATVFDLGAEVREILIADVARLAIDLDRARDDRTADGVVKRLTAGGDPIWRRPPDPPLVRALTDRYWSPFHWCLTALARSGLEAGIDGRCFDFGNLGPATAPRPLVRLAAGVGACPPRWLERLRERMAVEFDGRVVVEAPAKDSLVHLHGREMPWIQVGVSNSRELATEEKRLRTKRALRRWSEELHRAP